MRRSHGQKWLYDKGGDLIGIGLGSDFCAEHEWGVEGIRSAFACDSNLAGVDKRIIRELPKHLRLLEGIEDADYTGIFLSSLESYFKQPLDWLRSELKRNPYEKDSKTSCAWDEKSFGIVGWEEKDRKNVRTLWDAFQRMDIAFWPNIGAFHTGGGLIFAIPSKIPQEDKDAMLASDLDYKKLLQAAKDTGIEERLGKAGKRFYALTPKWAKEIKNTADGRVIRTKHPVMFWLNPAQQQKYNYGYFTVEDLDEWAEDKGVITQFRER